MILLLAARMEPAPSAFPTVSCELCVRHFLFELRTLSYFLTVAFGSVIQMAATVSDCSGIIVLYCGTGLNEFCYQLSWQVLCLETIRGPAGRVTVEEPPV